MNGLDMTAWLGPHWGFIVAAYSLAVIVIGGLIVWVNLDHRAQLGTLADLDARGVRRRVGRETRP